MYTFLLGMELGMALSCNATCIIIPPTVYQFLQLLSSMSSHSSMLFKIYKMGPILSAPPPALESIKKQDKQFHHSLNFLNRYEGTIYSCCQ